MRYLGIDYGRVWVGVAISEGIQSQGLYQTHRSEALGRIIETVKKHEIDKIVIGLSKGFLKQEILDFGEKLSRASSVNVEYIDETLSSFQARNAVRDIGTTQRKKRKNKEHSVAAGIILDRYFETKPL